MGYRYRLMVIDDALESGIAPRKDIYANVLSNRQQFDEPILIHKYSEFVNKINKPVDGYLIDLFLNTGDWAMQHVYNAAQLLNKFAERFPRPSAPIILISNRWKDFRDAMDILREIRPEFLPRVTDYIAWSVFESAAKGIEIQSGMVVCPHVERSVQDCEKCGRNIDADVIDLQTRLCFQLENALGLSSLKKKPGDSVRILLLSDPQFNDPHRADKQAETRLAAQLKTDGNVPDLVVIAGDVSYSGLPCEFVLARDRIRVLLDQLQIDKNSIILVPGNHDVNMLFSATGDYNYVFPDKENINKRIQERRARRVIERVKKDDRDKNCCEMQRCREPKCHQYALAPFRDFAFQLTGDTNWQRNENCSWVDNRFLHLGIRFVLLNTVEEMSARDPEKICITQDAHDKLLRDLTTNNVETFTIALSHHGEEALVGKNESDRERDNLGMLNSLFDKDQVQLWCFGHEHSFARKRDLAPIYGVCGLQLPTYRLSGTEQWDRGCVLLELKRKDDKVTKAEATLYAIDHEQKWSMARTSKGRVRKYSLYRKRRDRT